MGGPSELVRLLQYIVQGLGNLGLHEVSVLVPGSQLGVAALASSAPQKPYPETGACLHLGPSGLAFCLRGGLRHARLKMHWLQTCP